MVIKINPGQQALWRDPHQMQIGTGRSALRLGKLSVAQERFVAALFKGIADQQLPLVTKQLELADDEATELLNRIGGVLEQEPPAINVKNQLRDDFVASAFAEIIRASLKHNVDGQAVLIGRSERSIYLDNLASAGVTLAHGLAAAGIGSLYSDDSQKVKPRELSANGYPNQFAGHSRLDSLRSLLAAAPSQMKILDSTGLPEKKISKIDCAVLISNQVIEPNRYATWMKRGVPHISIVFDSEYASVSPLIIPGKSACLLCLERVRTAEDSKWPALASQLRLSSKEFDDSASRLFAAGIAVQKILAHTDKLLGFEVTENHVGYRLELSSGIVSEFSWTAHADCDCR